MSVFYLDTELTDFTIEYIAKICAESTYSIEEIEKIMFTEVWPAFIGNLWSVAGEWGGGNPNSCSSGFWRVSGRGCISLGGAIL